ncbi:MAG: T9SS type A sorting domain-containing protein [Chitinophagales bacterium]
MQYIYSKTPLPLLALFLIAFLTFLLPLVQIQAQINIQSIATDLNVCGEANILHISLTPTQDLTQIIDVKIELSEGIEYLENSLTILEIPTNISLNITNIPQPSELQLQIDPNGEIWLSGETLSFEMQRTANCLAIDFAQMGGTFEDHITLSQNGTNIAAQDANYGIQFASLSIFQPDPVVGDSGQKIFRNITINNGGFACTDDVTYILVLEQGLNVEAIAFGLYNIPLTFSGDTVFASLNEIFTSIGNGDECFDDGESITLREELRTYTCQTLLIETQHNVVWGCNANDCNPFSGTTGNVVVLGGADEPAIRVVPLQYSSPGTCTNGQGEFLVINEGTPNENDPGYIISLLVNLEWEFSKLIPPPCPLRAGVLTNIFLNDQPYTKGNYQSGKYAINIAANKDTTFGLTDADGDGFYDDLLAGDTLRVRYEMDFECFEDCFCDVGILTDASHIFYNDFCGASLYEQAVESGFTIERSYQAPQASLSNTIKVGQIGTLKVCSNIEQNLNCPSDQTKLLVTISDSLVLSPNLPNAYLTDGTPLTATAQNDSTIEVTGIEGISVNCILLDLQWTGQKDPKNYQLNFELLYECEEGCDCFEAIDCGSFSKSPDLDPLPDTCVNLLESKAFMKRLTFGWSDFDLQEKVDPNQDSLNLQFALACDTIRYQSQTSVAESIEAFEDIRLRLYYPLANENGEILNWLSGSLRWYDSEQQAYFDTPISDTLALNEVGQGELKAIDFDIESLFEPSELNNAHLSLGDSLFVEAYFVVVEEGLSTDVVLNPTVSLQYYAEDLVSQEPILLHCTATSSNIQLYQNKTALPDTTYVISVCEAQTLSMEWGYEIDTLENGPTIRDFFFNEIRPVFRFDSVSFRFPATLQYLDGSARMNYLPNPVGDYLLQNPNIEAKGEQLQYTFVNDGNWPIGDRTSFLKDSTATTMERIGGYFQMDFLADCRGYDEIEATFYIENNYHSTEPDCRNHLVLHQTYPAEYFKPQIGAGLITPNIDGLAGQVSAQLEFCNNTGQLAMSNAFLLFEAENEDISVIGANIGTLTTLDDGLQLLQLGDIAALQCVDIELQLAYSNCAESSILKVFYSWDCMGYPNNIDEMRCDNALRSITIHPKEAEVQLDVETPIGAAQLCDTMFYEFTINSAQLANITSPVLVLDLPPLQGLMLTDSTTIEYPLGTPPRAFTAAIEGNQLVIDLGLADAENEPIGAISTLGINGFALSSNANERKAKIRLGFTTDCNFVAGSSIRASVFANLPCGAPALGNGFSQLLPPILIQDVSNSYQTELQIAALPLQSCDNTTTIEVKIASANNQLINENDAHVYLFLPENLHYADNSLQIVTGKVEVPEVVDIATGEQLDFAIQFNDNPLDSIVFRFEVLADENFACLGETLEVIAQTIELQNANCSTDNEDCALAIQTNEGSAFFEIPTNGAAISLAAATATVDCAANDNEFELFVSFQNTGNQTSESTYSVEVYLDTNFNDLLDEEDVFLGSILYDAPIAAGQTVSVSENFGVAEVLGFPILVALAASENCESCEEMPLVIENLTPTNNTLLVNEQLFCIEEEASYEIVLSIEGGTPPYTLSGSVEATTSWAIFITDTFDMGMPYSITVTDAKGCFMQIAGIGDCVTLPIELIAFEGTVQKNGNFLQWFTASETNNDFYTLERSEDGKNFEGIGKIKGLGTTSFSQTYSFLDHFPPIGTTYYRLSQTDLNATTRYLGTVSLHRQNPSKLYIQNIYPIPTSDVLFIEFGNPSLQNLELELVNTLGQVVLRQNIEGSANRVEVDCSGLQKGLYLLKLGDVWEKVVVR